MNARRIETLLAWFSLGLLAVYAPLETLYSLPYGLTHPMYLVDLIGMVLLFWGALRSLRSRPRPAPGVLAAGWAWSGANGWRAASWRWLEASEGTGAGDGLDYGSAELWVTTVGAAVAVVCLLVSLMLVSRCFALEDRSSI